jgi:hypothetical protein
MVALLMKRQRRSDSYERFTARSPIHSDRLTLARESVGKEPVGPATSQLDVSK